MAFRSILIALFSLCWFAPRGWCEWRTYTTADGLVGNGVLSMVEDRSGSIWFGTFSGLSRYDGVVWRTYIAATYFPVSAMHEDRSGNLWFATPSGVSRFDGSTWRFFTTTDGLANEIVHAIIEDRSGALWFGTNGGASRFDGSTWRTFTTADGLGGDGVSSIFEDQAGNLWFGTTGGLSRFEGSSWRNFTTADGLAANAVYRVNGDRSGNIWIGYEDQVGITRYDGTSWRTFTTSDGLAFNFAYSIRGDRSGNVWIGTAFGGLSRYDGVRWTTFTTAEGLSGSSVYSILEDQSGNLWFGTNGGASRFDGSTWRNFTTEDGLVGNLTSSVFEDASGNLWFGTNCCGVARFDGAAWTSFTTANGLASNNVQSILQDRQGNLWFATLGGVSRYDGLTWRNFSIADGLAHFAVNSILEDRSGNLWFGTQGGLNRYDGHTWQTFTTADGLIGNDVRCMVEDRAGNLWFGTQGNLTQGGVTRYDGTTWRSFTTADGLAFNWVQSMAEDRSGDLWFGTSCCGVSRYDGSVWRTYTTPDGLGDNTVYSILKDRSGNLWFGTRGGVTRYDGVNWRIFNTADGFLDNNVRAILEDRSGSLWFGTDLGVSRYDPDRIAPQTVIVAPPSRVTSARDHTLAFAAFGEVDRVDFSYRLDGGSWSDWNRATTTFLPGLADGPHIFEACSRDYLVNTDDTPARALFEVDATPPAPVIAFPPFGQAVKERVGVRGTVADARFTGYRLEVRAQGAASWNPPDVTLIAESSTQVSDALLGTWDTSPLVDGNYELRVSVTDSLGLTGTALVTVVVDNHFPYAPETAPAKVTAASGGDLYTTNQELHLYFPPHAFDQDAIVSIAAAGSPSDTLPSGAVRVLPGYDIAWSAASLRKPATLEFSTRGRTSAPGILTVYSSSDGTTWQRLGGTPEEGKVSLAIREAGRYTLFAETAIPEGRASLSVLSLSPRVFSPAGTFAADHVGIGFTLGRSAPVTVRIYNRAGRLVSEVVSGRTMGAGANLLRWDGRDRAGVYVADGIYLVTVEALGQTRKSALAVVR